MHLYDLWEDKYRQRIADDLGLESENEIESDSFGDLRHYLHAITHSGGILNEEVEGLRFRSVGEPVNLSHDDRNQLFRMFIDEVNRLARVYYGTANLFVYERALN